MSGLLLAYTSTQRCSPLTIYPIFQFLKVLGLAQTLREAAQRGRRPSADVAVPEGVAGHLHAVAGALGALGMDTLKEFQVLVDKRRLESSGVFHEGSVQSMPASGAVGHGALGMDLLKEFRLPCSRDRQLLLSDQRS